MVAEIVTAFSLPLYIVYHVLHVRPTRSIFVARGLQCAPPTVLSSSPSLYWYRPVRLTLLARAFLPPSSHVRTTSAFFS